MTATIDTTHVQARLDELNNKNATQTWADIQASLEARKELIELLDGDFAHMDRQTLPQLATDAELDEAVHLMKTLKTPLFKAKRYVVSPEPLASTPTAACSCTRMTSAPTTSQ